ncbi:Target of rapamycin complex 2 subunit-like protein [Emericellopsis cladophorae]|uniref:Target of rapamycin complex 2 subunit-like protein n=1 Tax=Emericellopsis cladophorae TaxID=2686198 RepID=A0A9Q0BG68_9HYPO|nr:Target of rapamycin complex 2 subunit-like protein [Emericellopsis cladophorae]KAI6783666.1 Target of rapamycin complex 2 subunit-like protein [Emericellopsis cladophorae]
MGGMKNHARKHSATPGLFEPSLPSTSTSNLGHLGMSMSTAGNNSATSVLSASQIAAQAAVMSHQHSQQHARQRSSTVPHPNDGADGPRRGSGSKGPVSPPTLSLTEASAPRDAAFGTHHYQQGRLASGSAHSSAATAAANVVFPRSGHNSPSPGLAASQMPPPPIPPPASEKPSKSEKARAKLFSRPSKISTKSDTKEKPLPSPGKIGSALSALQRGNFSTTSLVEPNTQALYSHSNSSAATIRPSDALPEDKGKEKEKKHHFLSRQKHKLKDEFHLPLSSVASNSVPTDPNAPKPLYNFNLPPSPGVGSSNFVKAKKEKKLAERSESRLGHGDEAADYWSATGSVPNLSQQSTMYDPIDPGKLGLQNQMTLDDAWPYLKAKLLVIFEGEDLRLPVEDFNRVVQMHIQYCIHRRSPNSMLEDLRDLLSVGFSSLDRTLRKTPEERFIPTLVELWLFTFTSILPYMQSVFLPLDLEVSGGGTIMNRDQARDFWGGVVARPSSADGPARVAPAATVLDVRRLVLIAYRDSIILPRYDKLRTIFSRLSLEFLPSSFNTSYGSPQDASLSTSPPESFLSMARPGTAMSLDPSNASYNSSSTTLFGESSVGSADGRSRAISNVSFGSHGSEGGMRPFTPSGVQVLGSVREQNVEDSKQVTEMVGRMLQCMSVLASLGGVGGADDEGNRKVIELCKMLKLNWLGRGRTGRNRMGIVGGRVKREGPREELRVS